MPPITQYRRATSPVRSLQSEVNRLFEDLFPWRGDAEETSETMLWSPAMDVSETDDMYRLRLDLPGVRREDVKINTEGNRLTISGERHREKKEENRDFLRVERSAGSFYRSMTLPAGIDADQAKASFDNGVLTVNIPKIEKRKAKEIQIR